MENSILYDAYRYLKATVAIFGIIGNSLVIISIFRQRSLLKSNYYFVVLQLAVCDLSWLVLVFLIDIDTFFKIGWLFQHSFLPYCFLVNFAYVFQIGGIGIMLIISVLRHRAVVHPLEPPISRRKLRIVCSLIYTVAFVVGYGTSVPECFLNYYYRHAPIIYLKSFHVFTVSFLYYIPTIYMAVIYYEICRALIKQNKHLKRVCSDSVTRNTSSSSSTFRFYRNRGTAIVSFWTVLCYGLENLLYSVTVIRYIAVGGEKWLIGNYYWIYLFSIVVRIAGSCAVNPLIYGILDKKLLMFRKLCLRKKRRTQEN